MESASYFCFTLLMLRMRRRRLQNEEARESCRRYWVHPLNVVRPQHGTFYTLYQELQTHPDRFHSYIRKSHGSFEHLLNLIGLSLQQQDTTFRLAISPRVRFFLTLR